MVIVDEDVEKREALHIVGGTNWYSYQRTIPSFFRKLPLKLLHDPVVLFIYCVTVEIPLIYFSYFIWK